MRIQCRTLFDCTSTGVVGHFKISRVPFVDRSGKPITDLHTWNKSRNQQRNFETILQLIGLRSQPEDITDPQQQDGHWWFEFEVKTEGVFGMDGSNDEFAALINDCIGVPMVINLDETAQLEPVLYPIGPDRNIWFESLNKR